MNLTVDIGNSFVKMGSFNGDDLIEKNILPSGDLHAFTEHLEKINFKKGIIASVKYSQDELKSLFGDRFLILSALTPLPINLEYENPETLGIDRIANAVGAYSRFAGKASLAIDCGTCITLDLVDEKGNFLGGSISPGLRMQFEALHNYTANLPLVDQVTMFDGPGKSTEESIKAGVLQGTVSALDGLIDFYRAKYPELEVIITGGDTDFFAKTLKNTIFADPNLTLKGLNAILSYQNT